MMRVEAKSLLNETVSGLFPRWWANDTNQILIDWWANQIKRFDFDVAKNAFMQHKAESQRIAPVAPKVIAQAKKLQAKKGFSDEEEKTDKQPAIEYSCKCIEHPQKHKVDWVISFWAKAKNFIEPNPDKRRKKAEADAQSCELLYDGKWIPILEIDNEQTEL